MTYKKSLLTFLLIISTILVNAQKVTLISQEQSKKIDSIFEAYNNKPGIAIAIVQDGKTIFKKGYGMANLSYDIPVTSKTIFDVGSNSKQFTAACIFLLEQEGKLRFDDPIQKYLPEIPSYSSKPITIQHLIYDTSGLRPYLATLYAKNIYYGDSFDNEDVIKLIAKHKGLNFPVGTKHSWSHTNYALLASIVEKASGKSLRAYAKEKIFNPLGMVNTYYREDKDTIVKNTAIGYQSEDDKFKKFHYYNHTVVGNGGLHTNLEDFARWSNNLKTGTVGGTQFIKRMVTPGTLANGKSIRYAGGVYSRNYYDIDGFPAVAASGTWGGFQSLFYKFINQDLTVIILSNNANTNPWGQLDQIVPLFLEDEIAQARQAMNNSTNVEIQKPLSLSKTENRKFSGMYYNTFNGELRQIELDGNRLMYKRAGANPTPLVAISPNELIYENAPQVKFTFNTNSYDSMVITVNDGEPMPYQKYSKHSYKHSELKQFENNYFNEDMDEMFELVAIENELGMLVKGKEIIRFKPVTIDLFTSKHSGYIVFERNRNNKITGFTRYDNILYNLKHTVVN
ncbi:serine hydrolase domain-containing protein [Winogradskyella sp. R77965]|uniref:serine hydrolase domain-containing protein n=1 Tax=Winogradskyella sp. R77965 TaxID=3093872 RepID=UPI0037DD563D